MMRGSITASLLAIVVAAQVQAQTTSSQQPAAALPQVYKPEQLTPVQRQARDAVSSLRDSVSAAGGALSRISVDVQTTSLQVLESRATTVVDRCAAAERQRTSSISQLSSAALTTEGELKARKDMLKEMNKLKKSLDLCTSTYQPLAHAGKGQEVRDYGPTRAKPILAGFQQFDQSLKPFSKAMAIQFRPLLNAGKSPLD